MMNPFSPAIVIGIIATNFGSVVMLQANQPDCERPSLKALAMIESGVNDYAVGKKGERSRYQISKATWKESSNRPFSFAYREDFATEAAIHYKNRIANRFMQECGHYPTDLDFYVMWNWGPKKYRAVKYNYHKVPAVVRDAAQRYSNLVYMYKNLN